MEPWLDSLSEDWNSEPRSSSPAASLANKSNLHPNDSVKSSQSRIPHLAQNLRSHGSNRSILRSRSARGRGQSNFTVLKERTASSLNITSSSPGDAFSNKQRSTLPSRRVSSAFSSSQQSVQHHSVREPTNRGNTPEWKRRLTGNEDFGSDGADLFSPSKLEGMFKQSSGFVEEFEDDDVGEADDLKPWNLLKASAFPAPHEQMYSVRISRGAPSGMAVLEEVSEEGEVEPEISKISSNNVRDDSKRDMVKSTTGHFEELGYQHDTRYRTHSGRQEIHNEDISPVTASKQNSIREQALQENRMIDPQVLRKKILDAKDIIGCRPNSRSSADRLDDNSSQRRLSPLLHEEHLGDITSHSLPEDLSVGTQDLMPLGGFVTQRRGFGSNDTSFMKHRLSSSMETSRVGSQQQFQSSPPLHRNTDESKIDNSRLSISCPSSPRETSVIHKADVPGRPSSAGTPLKLFGNRDTYTNNKLIRILTHYEKTDTKHAKSQSNADTAEAEDQEENGLRMSQFGQGELDGFDFHNQQNKPANSVSNAYQPLKIVEPLPKRDVVNYDTTNVGEYEKEAEGRDVQNNVRSPKRRRTRPQDELVGDILELQERVNQENDTGLAGKKRKDARPGKEVMQASPETLALRNVLRPRSGSRKPSIDADIGNDSGQSSPHLTEALAAELQDFAKATATSDKGSRKPSLATKDYMAEAEKVMEFIRARGKSKPHLPDIKEPEYDSELNPDAILDLDVDDSTKDSFSRPPSRVSHTTPHPHHQLAQHSPAMANHLRKYRDSDDLDILTSTIASEGLPLADNGATEEAAQVPLPNKELPASDQESSPPGIRIIDSSENMRKRRHSTSSVEGPVVLQEFPTISTKQTVASNSSGSSGHKGVIASGTVSIPNQIGTMTFDYKKGVWVRKTLSSSHTQEPASRHGDRSQRLTDSEADPFEDIPDLSIDEQREAVTKPLLSYSVSGANVLVKRGSELASAKSNDEKPIVKSINMNESDKHHLIASMERAKSFDKSQQPHGITASQKEEQLYYGLPSRQPFDDDSVKRQARVVTIAFSSPIASDIPYHQPPSISDEDIDEDDPSLLPLDDDEDSRISSRSLEEDEEPQKLESDGAYQNFKSFVGNRAKHEQYRAMTLNRRPVSRIDEQEENSQPADMSLVRVSNDISTPSAKTEFSLIRQSTKPEKSMLSLTPLSDFTIHQADRAKHPEESYVAERANPKTLRQAHGSHALIEDALVKAITDAEPSELFWEQFRKLKLEGSRLTTLHGLKEYCSALENLNVSQNLINQLDDLPESLRTLSIAKNMVNDLTSWGHLQNLQYVDVSRNNLESLEAFSNLFHLRRLDVSHNHVQSINGISYLEGLISLNVSDNELAVLDFTHSCLTQLEELDASNNNIDEVVGLHQLSRLLQLELSGNSLGQFKLQDGEVLANLRQLQLADNNLELIDLRFFPTLNKLNIDGNAVRKIEGLSQAQRLVVLSARDQNNSHGFIQTILSTPNDCSDIHLSCNSVPSEGLQLPTLPHYNLQHLELTACGLHCLPEAFGDYFPNLRHLNLNFNAVQDLTPLLGMVKLQGLLLAKNRIAKMRRTCLTLSRIPALVKLDIRDNPLTVGFYAPHYVEDRCGQWYSLPQQSCPLNLRWWQRLDETTSLRKRTMELLLAGCCLALTELDGMDFDRGVILQEAKTWQRLQTNGILKKVEGEAVQRVRKASSLQVLVDGEADVLAERSVMME